MVEKNSARMKISLHQFMYRFDIDEKALCYIEERWSEGRRCGFGEICCASHNAMSYWCSDCRKYFSMKNCTLMVGSHIGYDKWMMVTVPVGTLLNGVSSTKLASDIGVMQKCVWFLVLRTKVEWEIAKQARK